MKIGFVSLQPSMRSDLEKGDFRVDGVFVEYVKPRANPRPDPIIFVHGGCHGSWCWENYLPYFADAGWECYALNWYNHYKSDSLPLERFVHRSLGDVVEEIGKVANQVGELPIVIGHSMGGLASQKYAEGNPVKALVLVAPGVPAEAGGIKLELPLDANEPFGPPPVEWAREHFFEGSPEEDVQRFYPLLCAESPRAVLEVTNPREAVSVDKTRISSPILLIGAELDKLAPEPLMRNLANHYSAVYLFMPGRGHNLLLEPGWQETAGKIVDWLDRTLSQRYSSV